MLLEFQDGIDTKVKAGRKKSPSGPQNLRILMKTNDFLTWLYNFQISARCQDAAVLPHVRGALVVPPAWLKFEPVPSWNSSKISVCDLFHLTISEDNKKLNWIGLTLQIPNTGLTLTSVELGDDFLNKSARFNFQSRGTGVKSQGKWLDLLTSTITAIKNIKLGQWAQSPQDWSPWPLQQFGDLPIVIWARPSEVVAVQA